MVCERDPESRFDPREGRIDVRVDDDWVRADGTTLGADNGIGVALALALVDDPAVAHGPLELLLTVSEEQGLDGAKALDAALVSGRLLVNLDGASDAVTVGCAGSDHTVDPAPAADRRWRSRTGRSLRVALSGARGGHSGEDIAAGRVNAIKALGQILEAAFEAAPFGLVSLDGGVSRNAIPRAAQAVVAVADERRLRAGGPRPSSQRSSGSTRARTTHSCSSSSRAGRNPPPVPRRRAASSTSSLRSRRAPSR